MTLKMTMKVEVDRERCQGHGQCVIASPELFELDEEDLSRPLYNRVTGDQITAARSAEIACPVGAIRVYGPQSAETTGMT